MHDRPTESRKALVVYKLSQWEYYSRMDDASLQAYLHSGSDTVKRMRRSHDVQKHTLDAVVRSLAEEGWDFELAFRDELHRGDPKISGKDLVVAVGGDGTVLGVSHLIDSNMDIPLLGVNSDPNKSVGFYCAATSETVGNYIHNYDSMPRTELTRLQVVKNGQKIPDMVLNEVHVSHVKPGGEQRYEIAVDGKTEEKRDNGLYLSTASGSTGIIYNQNGEVMPLDSDQIQYIQRRRHAEPHYADEVHIRSLTREGKFYIDGTYLEHDFGFGDEITIQRGRPITIIGDLEANRPRVLKVEDYAKYLQMKAKVVEV